MLVMLAALTLFLAMSAWFALRGELDGPLRSRAGAIDLIGRVFAALYFIMITALMWKGGLA